MPAVGLPEQYTLKRSDNNIGNSPYLKMTDHMLCYDMTDHMRAKWLTFAHPQNLPPLYGTTNRFIHTILW